MHKDQEVAIRAALQEVLFLHGAINVDSVWERMKTERPSNGVPGVQKARTKAKAPKNGSVPRREPKEIAADNRKVFTKVKNHSGSTCREIAEMMPEMHLAFVKKGLKDLCAEGKIKKKGERSHTKYTAK